MTARWRPPVVAACLLVGLGIAAWSLPAGAGPVDVEITIRHSRFEPAALRVRAGTTVRFVVRNTDPISHELLIGDRAAQDAHERGTERRHGAKPGEVSVPALGSATTTMRFDDPGTLLMGCHLPGHWRYGMRGVVVVERRAPTAR